MSESEYPALRSVIDQMVSVIMEMMDNSAINQNPDYRAERAHNLMMRAIVPCVVVKVFNAATEQFSSVVRK